MSSSGLVAYNPNDPVQQAFLSALALGETGNSSYAATEGVGGVNLADDTSENDFGFPTWQGEGDSHAAGIFQFEPATWDSLASQYGLNFQNTSDQEAGAWYLAQQTYQSKTGGSLYGALSGGNYSSVQSALASIWPSVTGNQAAPQGLAASLAGGQGSNLTFPGSSSSASGASTSSGTSSTASGNSANQSESGVGTLFGDIENWFERGGLIIVGGLIIIVALWALLASQKVVPSPVKVAKDAAGAIAA